jgi:hypothetical protein
MVEGASSRAGYYAGMRCICTYVGMCVLVCVCLCVCVARAGYHAGIISCAYVCIFLVFLFLFYPAGSSTACVHVGYAD